MSDIKRACQRHLPALGALVLALCGVALPVETAAVPLSEWLTLEVTLAPLQRTTPTHAALAERAAILELVSAHCRRADDARRQQLTDTIYYEALAADVDPLMVASIVARESSFKSRVVSHAGAVGLMQLRPFVARDVAQRSAMPWEGRQTLEHPALNVRIGIRYYKELVKHFDGDQTMALTAYNQGPTRVRRNVRNGTYAGSRYADRILDLYTSLSLGPADPTLALEG